MSTPILTLSAQELQNILQHRYPFGTKVVLDGDYNVPSAAAMEVFFKELGTHLFDIYGDKWQTYFDCDNFSLEAITLAYRKHWVSRQAGKGNAQGVAVGLLCFLLNPSDPTSGHCIGFWVDADKQIHEFEPQNRLPLPLSPLQCISVSFCFVS